MVFCACRKKVFPPLSRGPQAVACNSSFSSSRAHARLPHPWRCGASPTAPRSITEVVFHQGILKAFANDGVALPVLNPAAIGCLALASGGPKLPNLLLAQQFIEPCTTYLNHGGSIPRHLRRFSAKRTSGSRLVCQVFDSSNAGLIVRMPLVEKCQKQRHLLHC